ncbi:hypothetical protein NEOKW01_2105 [Nematocida sp. AWRm80]|nr:hypothetical protein NEOKW01_2105 [Nematocida sp. AWRm80]
MSISCLEYIERIPNTLGDSAIQIVSYWIEKIRSLFTTLANQYDIIENSNDYWLLILGKIIITLLLVALIICLLILAYRNITANKKEYTSLNKPSKSPEITEFSISESMLTTQYSEPVPVNTAHIPHIANENSIDLEDTSNDTINGIYTEEVNKIANEEDNSMLKDSNKDILKSSMVFQECNKDFSIGSQTVESKSNRSSRLITPRRSLDDSKSFRTDNDSGINSSINSFSSKDSIFTRSSSDTNLDTGSLASLAGQVGIKPALASTDIVKRHATVPINPEDLAMAILQYNKMRPKKPSPRPLSLCSTSTVSSQNPDMPVIDEDFYGSSFMSSSQNTITGSNDSLNKTLTRPSNTKKKTIVE